MAAKTNIVLDQGCDFQVTINVQNFNDVPVNLTGYTGYAQMRKHYTSSNAYSFGVTIVPQDGEVVLAMSANTTETIAAGRYVYDCELVSVTGIRTRIVEGFVTVTPQVTRNG